MSNLVSFTGPSVQILDEFQTKNFSTSGFLVKSLINKICHDFKTNYDIDMKPRPLSKTGKRNTHTLKPLTMTSCWQITTSSTFFRFSGGLEQAEGKLRTYPLRRLKMVQKFSSLFTFYLAKLFFWFTELFSLLI